MSAPTKPKKKGARLGTQSRGDLQSLYNSRGKAVANLWKSYSLKTRRTVVFTGNLSFLHFLHCESDPSIRWVDYQPRAATAKVGDTSVQTGLSAEVITGYDVLQLREVRYGNQPRDPKQEIHLERHLGDRLAECESGTHFRDVERKVFTEQELTVGHDVRLRNWNRILPWVAQAKSHSLNLYRTGIISRLDVDRPLAARDVLALGAGDSGESALYLAAAIEGAAFGRWNSDLNERPFCEETLFSIRGGA